MLRHAPTVDPAIPRRIRSGSLAGIQQNIVDNLQSQRFRCDMSSDVEIRETPALRRQRPLVAEVRDELERMILDGEIAAGERLNEVTLAAQMGVSRGPVREAARALEQDGLVVAVANQGVYVRRLSDKAALELYDLRAMIAGYLCARVASRRCAVVVAGLRRAVARMEAALSAGDEAGYFDLNLAFHDDIAAEAGADGALRLYRSLGKEVRLMRRRVLQGARALRLSNAEHAAIVEAIAAGDEAAAREAGARHHLNGKERLVAML